MNYLLFRIRQPDKSSSFYAKVPPPSFPNPFGKLFFGVIVFTILFMASKPFIEWDDFGNPRLAVWRQEKLDRELKDIEYAEQYALKVSVDGWYPCYSCSDDTKIYMHAGETWKFGVTTKGQKGRYGNKLTRLSLLYEIQFEGELGVCLAEERKKIYAYALFPENLIRQKPLIRPPGNKKDS